MVEVRVENLRKEFGDTVAVDDVSFTVEEGQFVTLVGPSGSGKTTTIRLIAGLEQATNGSIYYGQKDMTDVPPQERHIAMMFQDIALYPHMSVRDNMAYGLKLAGLSKADRYEKVREVAEWLQIADLLDNKPKQLSGGQQQRVALGRAIVRDPNVFLFDEPMSDLDAALKQELRPLVQEVTQEIGCPTVYVTHDQEEAMTMSDRIIVMSQGDIEQIGSPNEVYNDPDSRFVGQFIGQPQMQFFTGTVRENGSGAAIHVDDYEWDLPPIEAIGEYVDREIEIGIRPQDMTVSSSNETGIHAQHVLDEPLGDKTISFFDTDLGRLKSITPPNFQGNESEYRLQPDTANVKAFHPETGERIR